jgi:hypothetical protein
MGGRQGPGAPPVWRAKSPGVLNLRKPPSAALDDLAVRTRPTSTRFALAAALLATPGAVRGELTTAPPQPVLSAVSGVVLFVPSDIYHPAAPQGVGDATVGAEALAQAQAAVAAGDVSAALRHASRAAAFDPNNAAARRLLGYQRVGDQWAGGYAQRMLKSGQTWDREFGWTKAADLAKFKEGKRPYAGRWISAEEDARRHATIERGWAVRTDHFLVTTNIDRAAGVDLATRLETLYQLWQQLFGEFAATPDELKARLAGKQDVGFLQKPFHVVYHRNREEYNQALRRDQPRIDVTLGIYFDRKRESHFFAGPDQDPGTIAHEAVHQFFFESSPRPTRHLAATANVWAVEGVACYFESLVERDAKGKGLAGRCFTLGTPEAGRLPAARYRRVHDNFYVPLAELSVLGMLDLQQRPDVAKLYSQSAGLASFFIDYHNGVYRGAFRRLLAAIYDGRDSPDALAKFAGRRDEQLDGEYLEYMQSLPETAVIAPATPNR